MEHKHIFSLVAICGGGLSTQITFQCRIKDCKERVERQIKPEEVDIVFSTGGFKKWDPEDPGVHKLWHDFCRIFVTGEHKDLEGYLLDVAVEEWAVGKEGVKIISVDDGCHSSSSLVLIEHATKDDYMGLTAVYIPQNSGKLREPDPLKTNIPSEFFLYPRAVRELINALTYFEKRASPIMQNAHMQQRLWRKRVDKLKP